jgi:sugar phosphate isomerase/epimerase
VHNYCPRPTDACGNRIPDPSILAADDAERNHAIALTKATMELCRRVGGTAVVVHAGDLIVAPEAENRLNALYVDRLHEEDEFATLRAEIVAKRAAIAAPALEWLLVSLAELVPYAEATGIRLGIESRPEYRNIPSIDDLGVIFGRFSSPMLGYWHDTGHAQIQANLGYVPHEEWLKRYGHRLVAMHLHDCNGLRDHIIPGRGRVDWRMVVSYLRPDTVRVAELDHYFEIADIREGLDFLRSAGFERGGAGA